MNLAVTNSDEICPYRKIVEETIKEFGRLDILVNNAGVIELGTIENTTLEQYDRVMNINMRQASYAHHISNTTLNS